MATRRIPRELLQRPIAFHRAFVTLTGSLEAGLFLSQALYWQDIVDRLPKSDGWFYKTQDEWEKETALGRYAQEKSRKILKSLGVLVEKRVGNMGLIYFRIRMDKLEVLLIHGGAESSTTEVGDAEFSPRDAEICNTYKEAETTTETTPLLTAPTEQDVVGQKRKSRAAKPSDPVLDELKGRIRRFIQTTIEEKTGLKCMWDASEAKTLNGVVEHNKSWDAEAWEMMLRNWCASDGSLVRFGDRPRLLLSNITRFADGPLVRFGKERAS